jgi:uncharacterized protein YkwD
MNYIDILLGIILLLYIWAGWRKGFIIGILDLILLVVSLLTAFWLYPYVASLLEQVFPLGVWAPPLGFLITFFLGRLLFGLLANVILRSIPRQTHGHVANHALGTLPGLVNGLIYTTIIAALLLSLPIAHSISSATRDSRIAGRMADGAEWLHNKFSPVFSDAIQRTMNRLTVNPGSHESVELHYKVKDPDVRPDLEAKMLEMVNRERMQHGLKPVAADPEMAVVARAHSRDMFARGYFAHNTPEGLDPFDRMRAKNVRFLTAGENLALAQTLRMAHNGLMNSPGHRANILNPSYGRLGIGVLDGGIYGLMITQNFRN